VIVCPPMPGFYMRPQTIDDLIDAAVGRALDLFRHRHRPRQTVGRFINCAEIVPSKLAGSHSICPSTAAAVGVSKRPQGTRDSILDLQVGLAWDDYPGALAIPC
jgi:hypothetical protein